MAAGWIGIPGLVPYSMQAGEDIIPDKPGLEYDTFDSRLHYHVHNKQMHYDTGDSREHYHTKET